MLCLIIIWLTKSLDEMILTKTKKCIDRPRRKNFSNGVEQVDGEGLVLWTFSLENVVRMIENQL